MSKMSSLVIQIDEMLADGYTPQQIATKLEIPLDWVFESEDIEMRNHYEYDDSMDGDFDTAMASAGYGTDEDYGYYGNDEF